MKNNIAVLESFITVFVFTICLIAALYVWFSTRPKPEPQLSPVALCIKQCGTHQDSCFSFRTITETNSCIENYRQCVKACEFEKKSDWLEVSNQTVDPSKGYCKCWHFTKKYNPNE